MLFFFFFFGLDIPYEIFPLLSKTNLDEFSFTDWGVGVPPFLQKLKKINSAVELLGNLQESKSQSEVWRNIVSFQNSLCISCLYTLEFYTFVSQLTHIV